MLNVGMTKHLELTDADFSRVSKVVYEHCGINLGAEKRALVQSRLAKLVRANNFTNYKDYLDYVLRNQSNLDFTHFIDRLSTNLTSFFREKRHFDYLRETLIPSLSSKATLASPRIRCWSAGCSSGQEPYTLSITFSEVLSAKRRSDVKILATDISTRMVAAAKAGIYSSGQLEGMDLSIKKKYFKSVSTGESVSQFSVCGDLRKMLVFKQLNLMAAWPISTKLDFIFCRNVMIYFDSSTQERLVNRFYDVLAPGGVLFIGHSESLSGSKHNFKYVEPTIYQKGYDV